jgi:2-amino-4-hydroxy-6-hydroxymethyldihydropteridine diphosphokinase
MQPQHLKKYINVYLGLGSNMGDRAENLTKAIALIHRNVGKIVKRSHVYETEPWGNPHQDSFLNQVVMLNTSLEPREMLDLLNKIERELGRERKEKWGPRPIDIDILLYGKRLIRDKGLEIPHPELHKRSFVLVPLMEIAPELEHPVLKKPIDELYMECDDATEVVMLT